MKLIDVINTVQKEKHNINYPNWDDFLMCFYAHYKFDYFNYDHNLFKKHLVGYYHTSWICTDTMVGLCVWYLDGVCVAVSFKPARKADTMIEFTSISSAKNVFNFMKSCEVDKRSIGDCVNIINFDQDINVDDMPTG